MLVGCQTSEVLVPEYIIPSFDFFEPLRVPEDLIEEPMTDADLVHNSVQFEFLLYDWQDYADGLKKSLDQVRKLVSRD